MADAGGIRRRGLAVDRAKDAAWRRRSAIAYQARLRARRQAARLTSSIDKRPRTRSRNDWPPAVRRLARRRSGGLCEFCATAPATDLHHRKARRHRDHRICNALHLCRFCHDEIHGSRSWARGRGLTVSPTADPADVPVELLAGAPVFLTLTGDYREAA